MGNSNNQAKETFDRQGGGILLIWLPRVGDKTTGVSEAVASKAAYAVSPCVFKTAPSVGHAALCLFRPTEGLDSQPEIEYLSFYPESGGLIPTRSKLNSFEEDLDGLKIPTFVFPLLLDVPKAFKAMKDLKLLSPQYHVLPVRLPKGTPDTHNCVTSTLHVLSAASELFVKDESRLPLALARKAYSVSSAQCPHICGSTPVRTASDLVGLIIAKYGLATQRLQGPNNRENLQIMDDHEKSTEYKNQVKLLTEASKKREEEE